MKALKIIGIVVCSIIGAYAVLQFLFTVLVIIIGLVKKSGVNLSYMMGQMTGSIILMLLFGAAVRALVRSLKANKDQNPISK